MKRFSSFVSRNLFILFVLAVVAAAFAYILDRQMQIQTSTAVPPNSIRVRLYIPDDASVTEFNNQSFVYGQPKQPVELDIEEWKKIYNLHSHEHSALVNIRDGRIGESENRVVEYQLWQFGKSFCATEIIQNPFANTPGFWNIKTHREKNVLVFEAERQTVSVVAFVWDILILLIVLAVVLILWRNRNEVIKKEQQQSGLNPA